MTLPKAAAHLLVALLLFCAFRGTGQLYWDDTSTLANTHLSRPTPVDSFQELWRPCFASVQGDGYRPISCWIRDVGRRMANEDRSNCYRVFFRINAVAQGILAALIFLLALQLELSATFATIGVFLFIASTPNLTAALVLSSGIQALVPMLMSLMLLAYFAARKRNSRIGEVTVALLLLVGPYVREFLAVVPILLIFLELFFFTKNRRWLFGLSLALLHGIFPTALMKFGLFHQLPLTPIHRMGNLGAYYTHTSGRGGKQFRIFMDLFSLMPPTLLLACLGYGIWQWKTYRQSPKPVLFLIFYFAIAFLPFIKIFNEQVHLGYAMLPFALLLAMALQSMWARSGAVACRALMAGLIVLALVDQGLNFYSVRKVITDIYGEIGQVAHWLEKNVPPESPILSQALHIACIYVYSNYSLNTWASPGGFPGPNRDITSVEDLKNLKAKSSGDIYFLFLKTDPRDRGYPRRELLLLDDPHVKTEFVATIGELRSVVPFVDPLRNFLPLGTWVWQGTPDLEFDFYRGPARDGRWFASEVSASYELYKLKEIL